MITSFFFFFLSSIFVVLTLVAELEFRLFFYFFFFIFFSFLGKHKILSGDGHVSFRSRNKNFRFVIIMIFYFSLSLDPICNDMSWSVSFKVILIALLYIKTWLQTRFSLVFYRLSYQLFIVIYLGSVLIYLGFDRGFQTFFKLSNYVRLL